MRFFGSMSAAVLLAGLAGCRGEIGDDPSRGGGTGNFGGPSSVGTNPPNTKDALDVGTVPIHRLSNEEYNNTVRDLLGTTLRPADAFLSEEALGFDNFAEALGMNPRQVAGYYDAATKVAADVFGNMTARAKVLTCDAAAAGDTTCARDIITKFGRRAFRRPLEDWEITELVSRYSEATGQGLNHADAVQHVVKVILASPQFLYRMEFDNAPESATMHPLSAYEVASRLSFALWSSTPDDVLLDLAGSGDLLKPETLQAQVDRLLSDPRSSALIDNFAGQWLGGRNLQDHVVDTTLFPAWNENLRTSMQGELGQYFDEFLHKDAPFDQFLTADFNFVDANLAALYGMAVPGGTGLVKVTNTTDHRRGFLGLAGFLTFTSRNTRTAPSIRAKWVVNGLLCMTLEVPANLMINPLPDQMPGQTVRQQLEIHRAKPECAPCHNILDPVGLGLEHFDAIGRYRDTYDGGVAIDTAGQLPDGSKFNDFEGLTQIVSKDPRMVPCAAEKLFVYGLGRSVDPSQPYLDQVVANWRTSGNLGLRGLIKQFVVNDTFRFRHGSPPM
jgi:hypothetical protein